VNYIHRLTYPTVKHTAQPTHSCGNNVTFLELSAWCIFDETGRFDTKHTRILQPGAKTLTGE